MNKTPVGPPPRILTDKERERMVAQRLKERGITKEIGNIKRSLGVKRTQGNTPGDLIKRSKEIKNMPLKKRTAFMGLV